MAGDEAESLRLLREALRVDPTFGEAHNNLAGQYADTGRVEEAVPHYLEAARLLEQADYAVYNLAHALKRLARWGRLERLAVDVSRRLRRSTRAVETRMLHLLSQPHITPPLLRRVAVQRAAGLINEAEAILGVWYPSTPRHGIGLVTGDFRHHPVGRALVALLDEPDPPIPVACYYLDHTGQGDDDLTDQLRLGCTDYHRIEGASRDLQLVELLQPNPPEILVDLSGNTQGGSEHFFALRKGEHVVQVSYLGYPSTTGSASMHYYMLDSFAAPPHLFLTEFVEKAAYLCPSFVASALDEVFPNTESGEADEAMARVRSTLPNPSRVACVVGQHYKITPQAYDVWMAVLRRVPDAALVVVEWGDVPHNLATLRAEAAARGVDPSRVQAMPYVLPAAHARVKAELCTMVLDTPGYNGHVSTLDVLNVGLPVVSLLGTTFRGRAASSLLTAAGAGQLVASTYREYEDIAVGLLQDTEAALRHRRKLLQMKSQKAGLFDVASWRGSFHTSLVGAMSRLRVCWVGTRYHPAFFLLSGDDYRPTTL
eukprot:Sspe_Gene.67760::Locus_39976_Transcript_1_1_Confidence_1.000_Length_1623::g.67760::m.67760/K09667/OGT; protein O-GlcNAc transferase